MDTPKTVKPTALTARPAGLATVRTVGHAPAVNHVPKAANDQGAATTSQAIAAFVKKATAATPCVMPMLSVSFRRAVR